MHTRWRSVLRISSYWKVTVALDKLTFKRLASFSHFSSNFTVVHLSEAASLYLLGSVSDARVVSHKSIPNFSIACCFRVPVGNKFV